MSVINWFARNHVAANLLMACLLVGGTYTAFTIKKESRPTIETNMITINMVFRGAAPQDVEEGIIVKIEEAIQDLEGIKEITSSARRGLGTVQVEVEEDYDILDLLDQVKNRVDAIPTFPDNVEKPSISRSMWQKQVMMVTVYGDVDERTLKEFGKQVRNELVALPNVTRAEVIGSRDYEIGIEVSEFTLQGYGLTLMEVAQAVRLGSLDLPAGAIRSESGDILVRTKGQAYTGREFENIVIRTNEDGSRLLLKDIATIRDGFVEYDFFSWFDGEPALTIRVVSVGQQSELVISEQVQSFIDAKKLTMPSGIQITAWADSSRELKGRLNLMLKNLVYGALMVFLILTLFLRLKLAFWVMVGLPIAFTGALFLLPATGGTVNMMSLFGFILVLGIVVDDAIVIGESAYTNMRAKGHSIDHIIEGVSKVAVPATFGVLTTIAAFVPILLVSGTAGQFFAPIGWVVILCLIFSLVESKLILPAHLAHMKIKHYEKDTANLAVRFQRFFSEGLHHAIDDYYAPFLNKALNRRYLTLSIFVSALILSLGLVAASVLRVVFFPDIKSDSLMATIEMSDGTAPETTQRVLKRIQDSLMLVDGEISAQHGKPPYSVIEHNVAWATGQLGGQLYAEMVEQEFQLADTDEVLRRWRDAVGDVPGIKTLSLTNRGGGPGGGADVSLQLVAPSIEDSGRAAKELEQWLRQYESVYDIRNSLEHGTPEIKLDIKPEAESLGLTLADLARQVRAAFYGEEVQRVQRGQDEVRVMVKYPREERNSVGYLDNMRIRTADGGRVPFHTVAEVGMGVAPSTIQRFDRERAVRVSAEVDKEKQEPGAILKDILTNLMPELQARYPGLKYRLSGSSRSRQNIRGDLIEGALFALFLIYALMAIPLKSYLQPLIIMSVIPFGAIGALIGHMIIGIEVSMLSFFGLIALAGVVVNDSLILVDFVNRARAEGHSMRESVITAARSRFRAIVLTSLTTFFGLIPIVLETGKQAEMVIPMAVSLAFGILFATVITLFLIPVLYIILEDFQVWLLGAWRHLIPKEEPEKAHALHGKRKPAHTPVPTTANTSGHNLKPDPGPGA
jgi:multidrug efflux pump subunit AcrB